MSTSPWMHPNGPGATAPACCPALTQQPSALAARPRVPIRSHSRGSKHQCDAEGCDKMGKQILRQIHTNQIDLSKGKYIPWWIDWSCRFRFIGNDRHHCCVFHGRSKKNLICHIDAVWTFLLYVCAHPVWRQCAGIAATEGWKHSCLQQNCTMFLRNTLRASLLSPLPGRLSNWKLFIRFLNQRNKMDWHWYEDCETNRSNK